MSGVTPEGIGREAIVGELMDENESSQVQANQLDGRGRVEEEDVVVIFIHGCGWVEESKV